MGSEELHQYLGMDLSSLVSHLLFKLLHGHRLGLDLLLEVPDSLVQRLQLLRQAIVSGSLFSQCLFQLADA